MIALYSFYSTYEGSKRKLEEAIQIEWFITHFDGPHDSHKYSHTKSDKLNFRQAKKIAKKLGWVYKPKK